MRDAISSTCCELGMEIIKDLLLNGQGFGKFLSVLMRTGGGRKLRPPPVLTLGQLKIKSFGIVTYDGLITSNIKSSRKPRACR